MEKYILRFDEIRKSDISLAGGKGANLGELTAAGIPVPPGGVLTAQAYALYIARNGIDVSAARQKDGAQSIRQAIISGAFPDEISSQAVSLYRSLGENARVAVRSSATAEDLEDASFAGQQETFLNVTGEQALLDSVKRCYASLWGDRAVSYRAKQGYDSQPPLLAVVIQLMVESDSAGVCFTADPTGNSEDVIINASYGLGEAVVSGLVSPDEYRCSRDGKPANIVIGSKSAEIVYGQGGTVQRPVDSARSAARVLDDAQLTRLTACALDIEKHYGKPMDIEWAIKDGQIYILQARSITTAGGSARIFTDADFAGLPRIHAAKGRMRENMLFNLEKLPRPYYPLDHDFGDAVGKQKEKLIAEAGVKMADMCPIDADGISSFNFGGMKPGAGIVRIPGMIRQMRDDRGNVRVSAELLGQFSERLRREQALSPDTPAEIGASLERMLSLISDTAYARFKYAIFPQVLENIGLGKALRKIDPKLTPFDLMDGLSYVTADIDRDMAALARYIQQTGMEEEVSGSDYASLCADHPELAERFASFLEKYGNRSDYNCYCFTSRSWNDCPERFLGTLRTMLRGGAKVPSAEEGTARFNALLDKLRGSVSKKKYRKLERKINAVRHYHYIREATQYLWESEFALCRELLGKCAKALGTRYDDLMYLFSGELFDVCREGALSEKASGLIRRRREKRPLAEAYWDRCIEKALAADGGDITGVSGSAGTASGRVCVVSGPEEFDKLQRGEILVCPHTDPEWTPLFTLAAGVVVDTGGTLSHAAIVAREYGIPAVLATGSATKKLRDGDNVLVDGTSGTVTVIGSRSEK